MPELRASRSRASGRLVIAALALAACSRGSSIDVHAAPPPPPVRIPRFIPVGPPGNPVTDGKVFLGRTLFFDARLSGDGTIACVSCHDPAKSFTDGRQVAHGIRGAPGTRNTPSLLNRGLMHGQQAPLGWDGRHSSLEDQIRAMIEGPLELGSNLDRATATIASVTGYRPLFAAAFGDEQIDGTRVLQALASFVRTLASIGSPFDRFTFEGDVDALSLSARRGLELFRSRAGCSECHEGFNLTDESFHNLGAGMQAEDPDLGRYRVTGREAEKGAFKTPSLRDVARTAPYFHDGSLGSLEEVVDFFDRGGLPNPWQDPDLRPLLLSAEDRRDLVAFLKSLSSPDQDPTPPVLPR